MIIHIKSFDDIKKIRNAGSIVANILEKMEQHVISGISTGELDKICYNYISYNHNVNSAILGYCGFPKSICISVNEVVCHGIPSYKKKLKKGDIVNIDITVIKDGFYCDSSKMYIVDKATILGKRLCKVAKNSLNIAINMVKPGIRLFSLGKAIQYFVEKENFSVVKDYCGHGIGKNFHEDPMILNYYSEDNGVILQPGMVFTIEPMVNSGNNQVYTMRDGWTVKTKDHSLSAQYEHTVAVTNYGCEIITLRTDDNLPKIIYHNY